MQPGLSAADGSALRKAATASATSLAVMREQEQTIIACFLKGRFAPTAFVACKLMEFWKTKIRTDTGATRASA
jgi:hypothetical protein